LQSSQVEALSASVSISNELLILLEQNYMEVPVTTQRDAIRIKI